MNNKAALIILDGWGIAQNKDASAIDKANTSYYDSLLKEYPHSTLVTYGKEVGLPEGQMGNSEVGHLNIGAGRVVYQSLAKINKAIRENTLESEEQIKKAIRIASEGNKPVHLLGLLSDGGVHSHINHIVTLAHIFDEQNIQVYVHAFMDGRDTSQTAGTGFLEQLQKRLSNTKVKLSTIIGRYYAMDRDNRWERIDHAYQLLINGKGQYVDNAVKHISERYKEGVTDEFMEAIRTLSNDEGLIKSDDVVLFANFRTDRPRQLTTVLTQKAINNMSPLQLNFFTMTTYDESYANINVVFPNDKIPNTLGEVIESNGKTQLRIAETEKYPHVTFFFSGGREEPFKGETRLLVDSPKVATYDLQPIMSAYEVTTQADKFVSEQSPDLVVLNYANADMVGHTGDFKAAVKAVETLDNCMHSLIPRLVKNGYSILVIADHGNSDIMYNRDGSPHTAHTTNPVPCILISEERKTIRDGKLADIAPTLLDLLNIAIPDSFSGRSLCSA